MRITAYIFFVLAAIFGVLGVLSLITGSLWGLLTLVSAGIIAYNGVRMLRLANEYERRTSWPERSAQTAPKRKARLW